MLCTSKRPSEKSDGCAKDIWIWLWPESRESRTPLGLDEAILTQVLNVQSHPVTESAVFELLKAGTLAGSHELFRNWATESD